MHNRPLICPGTSRAILLALNKERSIIRETRRQHETAIRELNSREQSINAKLERYGAEIADDDQRVEVAADQILDEIAQDDIACVPGATDYDPGRRFRDDQVARANSPILTNPTTTQSSSAPVAGRTAPIV